MRAQSDRPENPTNAIKDHVLSVLNYHKPQHPPDMYYIRRNPNMLNKFLENEDHMLQELMRDASPQNARFYKLFKVSQKDKDNYERSIMPPKREKSPDDPYFKNLLWEPYHPQVHTTKQLMKKLEPYESRRFTDQHTVDTFLD